MRNIENWLIYVSNNLSQTQQDIQIQTPTSINHKQTQLSQPNLNPRNQHPLYLPLRQITPPHQNLNSSPNSAFPRLTASHAIRASASLSSSAIDFRPLSAFTGVGGNSALELYGTSKEICNAVEDVERDVDDEDGGRRID
jgi:hypothetical protein